jgi:GT2 family glycosyltransferase
MNSGEPTGISIVIVSYNTRDFLARCLGSLHGDPSDLVREIIVVDNASEDGSVEMIACDFPEVKLIRNRYNLGYARAVNRGMQNAGGRYLLILNPDIETGADAIRALWEFMETTPGAGVAGGKLLNPDGSLQMSCRTFYTLPVVLLRRTFLGRLFPDSRLVRKHLMLDWDHSSDREVDWVTGACMMVRREAYENAGGMDERFFLYFEDVDWCYRMRKHGWKVYYVPSGTMIHHYRRESAGLVPDRTLMSHLLSSFRFYDKWGSAVYALKRERRIASLVVSVVVDVLLINASFLLAYHFRVLVKPIFTKPIFPIVFYRSFMIYVTVVCLIAFVFSGLYKRVRQRGFAGDLVRTSRALFLGWLVIMASTYLTKTIGYSRLLVLAFWPISTLLVTAGRTVQAAIHDNLRRGLFDLQRVVVVGGDRTAVDLMDRLISVENGGYDFVGYVTPSGRVPEESVKPVVGSADQMGELVAEHRINQVIVSDTTLSKEEIGGIVIAARRGGAEVKVASEVTDMLIRGSQLDEVAGIPVVVFPPANLAGTRLLTKRVSDYCWAIAGVIGLALLSPVVFIYRASAGGDFSALSRAFRALGAVLSGRRSLVGPTSVVEGEAVKPGITGTWFVAAGPPAEAAGERADMYYIQNWSLSLDLEVIVSSMMKISLLFRPARTQKEGVE